MGVEYEERLVAYVDILGWSKAIETGSAASLYEVLEPLVQRGEFHSERVRQHLVEKYGKNVNPQILDVQFGFFSDCFIASMPTRMGARIYDMVSEIMRLLLLKGFLVRGGITAGAIFHRDQVAFGPSLLAAHRIEENEAIFSRVLVDDSAYMATGPNVGHAIMKDHLGNWIVDPFPRMFDSKHMRDALQEAFSISNILEIVSQNITTLEGHPRQRDIWRFQANVCAKSLEKYGDDIAMDWIECLYHEATI